MAYTTINKSTDYFNTVNYTGTGATQTISGIGHQPDWIWTKGKSAYYEHNLRDSVRGITKKIKSNDTSAEQTNTDGITATNSDGFILGADTAGAGANEVNQNGQNYVAWNWLANGTGSANTDGSITTTVSANTTAGFSIVSWTGTEANATVGHGLGSAPKMIIVKRLNGTTNWQVYHSSIANTEALELNGTGGKFTAANRWNSTTPTNTVFSVGNAVEVNASAAPMIAYCFTEKQGFSKFSKYVCNQNADGPFIYTGFKPAFVMIKRLGTDPWMMLDNRRDGYNVTEKYLAANATGADATEGSSVGIDLLSNGFKCRGTSGKLNSTNSGVEYIYMAFAEAPLVGDNPATAR